MKLNHLLILIMVKLIPWPIVLRTARPVGTALANLCIVKMQQPARRIVPRHGAAQCVETQSASGERIMKIVPQTAGLNPYCRSAVMIYVISGSRRHFRFQIHMESSLHYIVPLIAAAITTPVPSMTASAGKMRILKTIMVIVMIRPSEMGDVTEGRVKHAD
jgi:hypothetical protein